MKFKLYLMIIIMSPALVLAEINDVRLEAELLAGFDSNPYNLSEGFNDYESSYVKTKLMLTNRRNATGIYFRLNAALTKYLDSALKDDDLTTTKAELGYRWRPELAKGKGDFDLKLNYNSKNSTYYSKVTGQKANFLNTDISDRYDANWLDIAGIAKYPLREGMNLVLRTYLRNKRYDDFTAIGISNLDYKEFMINLGVDIRWKSGWRWTPEIIIKQRNYDDKRQAANDGILIANTDLEYSYRQINNEFKYQINDIWDLKLFGNYTHREDNGSGYYDTSTKKLGIRLRQKLERGTLALNIAFTDRQFDNTATNVISDLEEENKAKDGFEFKVTYKHNMKELTGMDWRLVSEIRRADYDNTDPFYVYDRTLFYIGFEGDLF